MKKNLLILVSLGCSMLSAQVKIGENPSTVGMSSILELESTNKALLITRVLNPSAIATPVNGMLIYDITSKCFKSFQAGAWTGCLQFQTTPASSVISAYSCDTNSTGTLYVGKPIAGVTQTITATVDQIGTYSISITTNGVTFAGSGNFTSTGPQTILLTGSGIPSSVGTESFMLPTTPSCTFSREILPNPSTNGTAVVSNYVCNNGNATLSVGTMFVGIPLVTNEVKQTITATVTKVGTYNITNTFNGVTFASSGTFTSTGNQNIDLFASGTPTLKGNNTFNPNIEPSCDFTRFVFVKCAIKVNATEYKQFLCHNLGADTTLDPDVPVKGIHGSYYQWGKSNPIANADTPSGAITGWSNTFAPANSWSNTVKTANDPCPSGYRVPTLEQWRGVNTNNSFTRTGTWTNSELNFGTALHVMVNGNAKSLTLPATGYRNGNNGALSERGKAGRYQSSTFENTLEDLNWHQAFDIDGVTDYYFLNPDASAVRCIEE